MGAAAWLYPGMTVYCGWHGQVRVTHEDKAVKPEPGLYSAEGKDRAAGAGTGCQLQGLLGTRGLRSFMYSWCLCVLPGLESGPD